MFATQTDLYFLNKKKTWNKKNLINHISFHLPLRR